GVALIYTAFGAPDVATTQIMVEALSAVLFGMAMLRLPGIAERRSARRRALHLLTAGAAGLTVTFVVLAVTTGPLDRYITTYFEPNAYTHARGFDIVVLVLVDFRAPD